MTTTYDTTWQHLFTQAALVFLFAFIGFTLIILAA